MKLGGGGDLEVNLGGVEGIIEADYGENKLYSCMKFSFLLFGERT